MKRKRLKKIYHSQSKINTIIIHSKYFAVSNWLQFPGLILHNQLSLTIFASNIHSLFLLEYWGWKFRNFKNALRINPRPRVLKGLNCPEYYIVTLANVDCSFHDWCFSNPTSSNLINVWTWILFSMWLTSSLKANFPRRPDENKKLTRDWNVRLVLWVCQWIQHITHWISKNCHLRKHEKIILNKYTSLKTPAYYMCPKSNSGIYNICGIKAAAISYTYWPNKSSSLDKSATSIANDYKWVTTYQANSYNQKRNAFDGHMSKAFLFLFFFLIGK